jgi:ABC-2 type transport system permease protein
MTSTHARAFGSVLLAALAAGCGASRQRQGVTQARLEQAVAPTFANLVHVQEERLGLPPVDAASLDTTASCKKVGASGDTTGAGTWRCTITWHAPRRRAPLVDGYEVSVRTDGCYTATVDGAEAHMGGPVLETRGGASVRNLLYAFDGCFDTAS